MATKVTKAGPRRIVYSPGGGDTNTAHPPRSHPILPVGPERPRPRVGTSGPPNPQPVFPVAGHFTVNNQNNVVRVSSPGQAAVAPGAAVNQFQARRTPSGNPTVAYAPKVGVAQEAPTIKITGTPILANKPLPGNQKRRGAQPASTVLPYSRKTQSGGQAYLPSYKRTKMGRAG